MDCKTDACKINDKKEETSFGDDGGGADIERENIFEYSIARAKSMVLWSNIHRHCLVLKWMSVKIKIIKVS